MSRTPQFGLRAGAPRRSGNSGRGYAVVVDSQEGRALGINILALTDKCKHPEHWWTSDAPEMVMCYHKEHIAKARAEYQEFGNARVMDYPGAVALISQQKESIEASK